jgi:formate hydrogenlyase subunit 6/NADH:ubiquinone oxidoreductase subunit I
MCAYVCVSESVTGASDETQYHWRYEPGRCTFCARCVDRCPADALSMSAESPPVYSRPGELDTRHAVPFPPCKVCGKPTRPTPETMKGWVAENIQDEAQHLYGLCDRCRRLHYQTAMKSMMSGTPKEELR